MADHGTVNLRASKEETNRALTEALGGCWPEWKTESRWDGVEREEYRVCTKCGLDDYRHPLKHPPVDFYTYAGLGMLWSRCRAQQWWPEFSAFLGAAGISLEACLDRPGRFAERAAEFLKEKGRTFRK